MEIAEGGSTSAGRRGNSDDLTDIVFSWSLDDILSENLYHDQVETIRATFQSVPHYIGFYVYPVLKEVRASSCSSSEDISVLPFAEVTAFVECNRSGNKYDVKANRRSNESDTRGKETCKTLPGDILILTNAQPETAHDLKRSIRWAFASVMMIGEDVEEDEMFLNLYIVKEVLCTDLTQVLKECPSSSNSLPASVVQLMVSMEYDQSWKRLD